MRKWRTIALVLVALIMGYYATIGSLYVLGFRWYRFPNANMEPTIPRGSSAVGRLTGSYRDHVARFDIAITQDVFGDGSLIAYRVFGLPGERVITGEAGVMIDGKALQLPPGVHVPGLRERPCDILVPAGCYFLLGDNTSQATDSRVAGAIPKEKIVGKILFKK